MHPLLLVKLKAHLVVFQCQGLKLILEFVLCLEGSSVFRVLLLQSIHFRLHVLDAEVLQLENLAQVARQVRILLVDGER